MGNPLRKVQGEDLFQAVQSGKDVYVSKAKKDGREFSVVDTGTKLPKSIAKTVRKATTHEIVAHMKSADVDLQKQEKTLEKLHTKVSDARKSQKHIPKKLLKMMDKVNNWSLGFGRKDSLDAIKKEKNELEVVRDILKNPENNNVSSLSDNQKRLLVKEGGKEFIKSIDKKSLNHLLETGFLSQDFDLVIDRFDEIDFGRCPKELYDHSAVKEKFRSGDFKNESLKGLLEAYPNRNYASFNKVIDLIPENRLKELLISSNLTNLSIGLKYENVPDKLLDNLPAKFFKNQRISSFRIATIEKLFSADLDKSVVKERSQAYFTERNFHDVFKTFKKLSGSNKPEIYNFAPVLFKQIYQPNLFLPFTDYCEEQFNQVRGRAEWAEGEYEFQEMLERALELADEVPETSPFEERLGGVRKNITNIGAKESESAKYKEIKARILAPGATRESILAGKKPALLSIHFHSDKTQHLTKDLQREAREIYEFLLELRD
jgi:soluble cytochrome b562